MRLFIALVGRGLPILAALRPAAAATSTAAAALLPRIPIFIDTCVVPVGSLKRLAVQGVDHLVVVISTGLAGLDTTGVALIPRRTPFAIVVASAARTAATAASAPATPRFVVACFGPRFLPSHVWLIVRGLTVVEAVAQFVVDRPLRRISIGFPTCFVAPRAAPAAATAAATSPTSRPFAVGVFVSCLWCPIVDVDAWLIAGNRLSDTGNGGLCRCTLRCSRGGSGFRGTRFRLVVPQRGPRGQFFGNFIGNFLLAAGLDGLAVAPGTISRRAATLPALVFGRPCCPRCVCGCRRWRRARWGRSRLRPQAKIAGQGIPVGRRRRTRLAAGRIGFRGLADRLCGSGLGRRGLRRAFFSGQGGLAASWNAQ